MDGTLIDSMWIWHKIGIEYLNKRNIKMPNLKDKIGHLNYIETAYYFKKRFNLSESVEEIIEEWSAMAYKEYNLNVKLKPGVNEFLDYLKSKNIKIALATSNNIKLVDVALKKNNIYHYFDSITTVDEVKRGKNFPDIYLLAAKKLNVQPEKCIVFEDILPAVISAKSAGMKVVGVHDLYSGYEKKDIAKHADMYIFKYDELTKAV